MVTNVQDLDDTFSNESWLLDIKRSRTFGTDISQAELDGLWLDYTANISDQLGWVLAPGDWLLRYLAAGC